MKEKQAASMIILLAYFAKCAINCHQKLFLGVATTPIHPDRRLKQAVYLAFQQQKTIIFMLLYL